MKKFCTNCGVNLKEGQKFCMNCGVSIDQSEVESENVNNNTSSESYTSSTTSMGKSKIAAGILALVFGTLGVHNFYLGYTGKAVAQLLITLLSCFILSPIVYVWAFIEGIMILTGSISVDGSGEPLSD